MAPEVPNPTPWVLLRGLGREARHWGDFPAYLAEALGNAPVHCPDLAGNGRHWRSVSATTIQGQCDGVRQALHPILAQGPVNLLALSLGGMVALDWAARHPAEVSRLVLINTSLAGIAPFWRRLRWQNYPALLGLLSQRPAQREQSILRLCGNHAERRAAVLADWQRWQSECPVSGANLLRQLTAAARYRPPENWPRQPTLLLCSRQDRLVDCACTTALAAAAHWPLRRHPTAGHDVALDAPQWLAEQVAAWCAEPGQ
ncbi:alpha/beta hydrolase [Chitinimonas arctica]|uniref:Alpha/beta hydrolase n=1 Tax=Chitinimonas arctica TaxID=2594795 RepID=A0A516SGI8_9NEIS|nr:alpha/beta hydrolase [Chitinimonas arctica]QDQ27138.1 alpha/beta hydrolase [Chitinimonas arctica]